jgi:hypothetical protein
MARLIRMAIELTDEVEDIARESGTQFTSLARNTRRNRLMIWILAGSLFLDVMITIVIAFIGVSTVNNTDRLDKITSDINATQTQQRTRALCPLYGIFLGAESEEGKKRSALSPEQYEHTFDVIEEGYLVLGCDKFLKESGKDAW